MFLNVYPIWVVYVHGMCSIRAVFELDLFVFRKVRLKDFPLRSAQTTNLLWTFTLPRAKFFEHAGERSE